MKHISTTFLPRLLLRRVFFLASRRYTKTHEWILFDKQHLTAQIGITEYAQNELGKIVHLQLAQPGKQVPEGGSIGTIESSKVSADVYVPFATTIKEINEKAHKDPTLINKEAEKTWLAVVQCKEEPMNLMTEEDYKKFIKN